MRAILCGLFLLGASVANAQPGQVPPPGPYAPAPQPYPQQPQPYPQPYAPPVYGYAPQAQVQLTPEDQELLAQGEITDGQHLAGGAVALFVGFGAGQAVQGRWSDTGWIFTLGEIASFSALIYGINKSFDNCFHTTCNGNEGGGYIAAGAVGFTVFRIWETIDALVGPQGHNRKVRELRRRTGMQPQYYGLRPFVAPPKNGGGAVAGVSLRF